MSDVRCQMSDVRCQMSDVWCKTMIQKKCSSIKLLLMCSALVANAAPVLAEAAVNGSNTTIEAQHELEAQHEFQSEKHIPAALKLLENAISHRELQLLSSQLEQEIVCRKHDAKGCSYTREQLLEYRVLFSASPKADLLTYFISEHYPSDEESRELEIEVFSLMLKAGFDALGKMEWSKGVFIDTLFFAVRYKKIHLVKKFMDDNANNSEVIDKIRAKRVGGYNLLHEAAQHGYSRSELQWLIAYGFNPMDQTNFKTTTYDIWNLSLE